MVSGSALKSFAFVIHRLSLKLRAIAALRRIGIPVDIVPLIGTRLNFLLAYGCDHCWNELLQVLPKLAGFFSSCTREKSSGIMKTEQAEQLLKAEFSCSLG